ncbi:MAG: flagellar basal body rod protein FlgB [Rhodanobacteraceae bacterium]
MPISINTAGNDSLFGLQGLALQVQSRRLSLISSNLANADTPNFQPRDIDFETVLRDAAAGRMDEAAAAARPQATVQPRLDGNGVDTSQQQAAFADAALRYEASLNFIEARASALTNAMSGS